MDYGLHCLSVHYEARLAADQAILHHHFDHVCLSFISRHNDDRASATPRNRVMVNRRSLVLSYYFNICLSAIIFILRRLAGVVPSSSRSLTLAFADSDSSRRVGDRIHLDSPYWSAATVIVFTPPNNNNSFGQP